MCRQSFLASFLIRNDFQCTFYIVPYESLQASYSIQSRGSAVTAVRTLFRWSPIGVEYKSLSLLRVIFLPSLGFLLYSQLCWKVDVVLYAFFRSLIRLIVSHKSHNFSFVSLLVYLVILKLAWANHLSKHIEWFVVSLSILSCFNGSTPGTYICNVNLFNWGGNHCLVLAAIIDYRSSFQRPIMVLRCTIEDSIGSSEAGAGEGRVKTGTSWDALSAWDR